VKFYWNEDYPEVIYVMGFDDLAERNVLYSLTDLDEVEPSTGKAVQNIGWHATVWGTSDESLKQGGFEFMGEL
jgi:hypothetical protein